jgi:hypothetical protein
MRFFYKDAGGQVYEYETPDDRDQFGAADLVAMTAKEVDAHLHPVMTEEQMKQSEIEQDKRYLADTDWIVAKIGEASLLGQDSVSLIEQYQKELDAREIARIRIRQNEGRA